MKEGHELNNLLARLKLEEDQINKTSETETTGGAFSVNFKKKKRESGNESIPEMKKITKCRNCHGHCPSTDTGNANISIRKKKRKIKIR